MHSEDYVGQRHGMLVISEYLGLERAPGGSKYAVFRFVCDCGNWFDAPKTNVVVGKRTHCGCQGRKKPGPKPKGT